MVWDGVERRGLTDAALLSNDMQALNTTVKEMHAENREGFEERGRTLDTRFAQVTDAIYTLALAQQAGDSKVAMEVAVHIASAHHAGTAERLNEHETRLNGHEADIGKLKQRLQHDEGHREAQTEGRDHHWARWGVIGTVLVGVGAVVASVAGSILQAWVALTSGGGHPPVK